MVKRFIEVNKNESGTVLIWALILLGLGSILIMPLLSLMGTGLKASYLREEKTREFYALDAGIEDAASRIRGDYELPQNPGDQVSYILEDEINGRQVEVTIESVWLLEGLESDEQGILPHEELVVVGSYSSVEEGQGSYQIEVSYNGSVGNLKIERLGVWLPAGFSYVSGSASNITTADPNIIPHRGGIALEWDFKPVLRFTPPKMELTFEFTPAMDPRGSFAWIRARRSDVYLSWDIVAKVHKVTSTAEDGTTGETVTAEAYLARSRPSEGGYPYPVRIIAVNYNV